MERQGGCIWQFTTVSRQPGLSAGRCTAHKREIFGGRASRAVFAGDNLLRLSALYLHWIFIGDITESLCWRELT